MSTETLETWLMGQSFLQQMEMLFNITIWGRSDIKSLALAAFFATHFDKHKLLWICLGRAGKVLPTTALATAASLGYKA